MNFNISILAGPLIGAVIGYCTNYIAVKMLFYPREEIWLFGHRLPFTPGAIPKGKKRLAGAVGKIVNEDLLTVEDIRKKLEEPEMIDGIADQILQKANLKVKDAAVQIAGSEEGYQKFKNNITCYLTDEILDSIKKLPIADMIVEKGSSVIKQMTEGTMLQMFISDELIASITLPVSDEIQRYFQENGRTFIETEINTKVDTISEETVTEMLTKFESDQENQREQIKTVYRRIIEKGTFGMLKNLNIAKMVEDKINAMAVEELETLVLIVMKKELNTIVNLGALIGFILGLLNLLRF